MSNQGDYELMMEREAQPVEDCDESITLSCGDGEAEVFYAADGHFTVACIGGVNIERDSFSNWQIEAWEKSIARHIQVQEEEAWAARFD